MPLLVTFAGRPVKRRRRVDDGLCLFFFHPVAGQPSERRVVSQSEWDADGKEEFLSQDQMPNVRDLAARKLPLNTHSLGTS